MTAGRSGRRAAVIALGMLVLASCATTKPAEQPAPPPAPAAPPPTPAPAPQSGVQRTNEAGRAIVKESEGLHLKAYRDAGQWFIGYGHAEGAGPGKRITRDEAEALLAADLAHCESKVSAALTRPASGNAFSAMVSLCFNIGWQPFTASTLVKRFNAGDMQGAADAFLPWSKATVDGVKTVLPRLEARRQRERALFLTPDTAS